MPGLNLGAGMIILKIRLDNRKSDYQNPISPIICPNVRGRSREGEEIRGTNSNSGPRERSRSPRNRENNLPENEDQSNHQESEEIEIPEMNGVPNTPTVEE